MKRFDEPICSFSSFLPDGFDDDFIQPKNGKDNDMSSEVHVSIIHSFNFFQFSDF